MPVKDKRRQWIISLGFSEADADNFIKLGVANWKIEDLANRLNKLDAEPMSMGEAKASEPEPSSATSPKSQRKSRKKGNKSSTI